jgi:hypothetical protein
MADLHQWNMVVLQECWKLVLLNYLKPSGVGYNGVSLFIVSCKGKKSALVVQNTTLCLTG